MKRIIIGVVALSWALAGCSAPDVGEGPGGPSDDSATSSDESPATGSSEELLAAHDLADMDAVEVIDRLDRLPVSERPTDLMASVQPDGLVLTDGQQEATMALPQGKTYVSIAPFVDETHDCFYHSLTTCLGEMSGEDVDVVITDSETGEALVDESTTTFDNGFVGFWVPSDISGTIEVTAEGKTGATEFSTKSDGPTCVTDLQLQ
ncbi:CueP family metal-binding protein [Brevibacterium sp. FAM 27836]|uniref:CueP family metal-binding protein n=1 Tax=Brevibacterium sp. FAM 27836 TaxID=3446693 RepID=UPI003F51A3C7